MTRKLAVLMSERLFGKEARVFQGRCEPTIHRTGRKGCSAPGAHGNRCPGHRPFAQVGFLWAESFFVRGAGRTWEKAFARARYKLHLESCQKWWTRRKCVKCTALARKAI